MTSDKHIKTSSFCATIALTTIILLVAVSNFSLALGGLSAKPIMKRGVYRLPAGVEVGDVIVSGGPVEIRGHVRGSIFSADGEVTIHNGGVVDGNVTIIGDDLELRPGAVITGSVYVAGGEIEGRNAGRIGGEVTETRESPSIQTRILLQKYLIFERPCPPPGTPTEVLDNLIREMRVRVAVAGSAWESLTIGELPAIPLGSDVEPGARLATWVDWKWNFTLGVAHYKDPKAAERMWESIIKTWDEDKVRRSVQVGLGDGAHWFFDHGTHATAIWISGNCMILLDIAPAEGRKTPPDLAAIVRDTIISRIVFKWTGKL